MTKGILLETCLKFIYPTNSCVFYSRFYYRENENIRCFLLFFCFVFKPVNRIILSYNKRFYVESSQKYATLLLLCKASGKKQQQKNDFPKEFARTISKSLQGQ